MSKFQVRNTGITSSRLTSFATQQKQSHISEMHAFAANADFLQRGGDFLEDCRAQFDASVLPAMAAAG